MFLLLSHEALGRGLRLAVVMYSPAGIRSC
jgi:hypothetical protein